MTQRCLALLLGLTTPALASAAELVVVLHPLNPTTEVSEKEVRKAYLGTTRYWEGGSVAIVTLTRPPDTPAGVELMEVCGISRSSFDELWRKRELAGQGLGPQMITDAGDVVAMVAKDPRAIGVVTAEEASALVGANVRLLRVPVDGAPAPIEAPAPAVPLPQLATPVPAVTPSPAALPPVTPP